MSWVLNDRIYVGGEYNSISIEAYNHDTNQWAYVGNLPENKYAADAVVLNEKVYVIAGKNGSSYSNKVYAADFECLRGGCL